MQEEGCKLKDELLNKKEPGHDNLGNSLPIQMRRDAKIKRLP